MSQSNSILNLFAVGVIGLLGYSGWNLHQAMEIKVKDQRAAISKVVNYKRTYAAVAPYASKWDATFPSADQVTDLYSMFQLFKFSEAGLKASPDQLSLNTNIERVSLSGIDLKLNKACVSAGGSSGFSGEADTFSSLLSALEKLAARKDLALGGVRLEVIEGKPRLYFTNLCLFLRDRVPVDASAAVANPAAPSPTSGMGMPPGVGPESKGAGILKGVSK